MLLVETNYGKGLAGLERGIVEIPIDESVVGLRLQQIRRERTKPPRGRYDDVPIGVRHGNIRRSRCAPSPAHAYFAMTLESTRRGNDGIHREHRSAAGSRQ